ncbi:MAG TPA: hypothetical protein PLJ60_12370 [Chryseolinea sp.]|nr:hypothetical protein [Chryseolinea sp.]HPH46136.1 hypothetical protein [Chryseolinea sp.]HPM31119.1 hypothetical protein [Chryseolinea sp.]
MKNVISALFILGCLCVQAQPTSYGNFKVADQEIIYQKISIADSITPAKLQAFYSALPYVSNIKMQQDGLAFDVTDIIVDYKKFQFSQVNLQPIMQTGKFSGTVVIGVKDGKYRLTLNAIQITGDMGYKKITTRDNLTNYACKNSGTVLSTDWCKPNMLGLLDQSFSDKLLYVEKNQKDKGDW